MILQNGELILEYVTQAKAHASDNTPLYRTDNQFIAYRVPVKSKLKAGLNELLIHFESAFKKGRKVEREHSKNHLWNGDSSRLHVRKAQYKCVISFRFVL